MGVEMMVSFQDRPEVVSWCCVGFEDMVVWVCWSSREGWYGDVKEMLPS